MTLDRRTLIAAAGSALLSGPALAQGRRPVLAPATAAKRDLLLRLARTGDAYAFVQGVSAAGDAPTVSFGGDALTPAFVQDNGLLQKVVLLLASPPQVGPDGSGVWPAFAEKPFGRLSRAEKDLALRLNRAAGPVPRRPAPADYGYLDGGTGQMDIDAGYVGWRAQIEPNGRFVTFAAGD